MNTHPHSSIASVKRERGRAWRGKGEEREELRDRWRERNGEGERKEDLLGLFKVNR